jgi:hypothetical protein
MNAQIQNYRNLIMLSDFYFASNNTGNFLQQLIWIEAMLDKAKTEIAIMASSVNEKEISRVFTSEVYHYLDTVIRPKITHLIELMSEDERYALIDSMKFSSLNQIRWVEVS